MSMFSFFSRRRSNSIVRKGQNAINAELKREWKEGLQLQKKYSELTNNSDILAASLAMNSSLPKRVRKKSDKIRNNIRSIIIGTSINTQTSLFEKSLKKIENLGLSPAQQNRYGSITNCHKELYSQYDSLRIGLEITQKLNEEVLVKINKSSDHGAKIGLMLLNSIIVYEMSDALIWIINNFKSSARFDLEEIHNEVIGELKDQGVWDLDLAKRADVVGNTDIVEMTKERQRIRGLVEEKWSDVWAKFDKIEITINEAKNKSIQDLELIRDNAKGQMDIIEQIAILKVIKDNLDSFQRLFDDTKIELSPLSSEDVCALLGVESPEKLDK